MAAPDPSFRLVLEITPPADARADVLLRRARRLGEHPHRINVIQREDRLGSLEAARILCDAGIAATANLVTRGRTRSEIEADLLFAERHALPSLLCVRGDLQRADAADTPTLRETIALARSVLTATEIGATLNPYAEGERVLKNLMGKLEAGADFVQTNTIFDLEDLRPFAEEIRARMPHVRIVPMVLPVEDRRAAAAIAARLGVPAPAHVGWHAFEALLAEIAASPLYEGVAIMTPRMDVDDETAARILGALTRAGS